MSPALIVGMTEADAYKVQFAVHDKICGRRADRIAGWKVALTLPPPVRAAEALRPGLRLHLPERHPARAARCSRKGYPIKPGIEPELVARIARGRRDGARPTPPTRSAAFVANVYCGMELVDNLGYSRRRPR